MSQATTDVSLAQLKAAVADKAAGDAAFRAELVANPKAAIEKLLGTDLPGNVKIQVVEEAADTYVIAIPKAVAADGELSDDDLEGVAGGTAKVKPGGVLVNGGKPSTKVVLPVGGQVACIG